MIKVIFFSSSEISLPLLRALNNDSRYKILYLVTQPDKPAGRSLVLKKNHVKVAAEKLGINVLQPEKLLSGDFLGELESSEPDILLTFAYGKILPDEVLKSAQIAPINIHASILPKYRGSSPIHTAILNGDKESGISVMKMVKELDAGPIFKIFPIEINEHFTAGILHDVIADKAALLVPDALAEINKSTVFKDQDGSMATYTKKMTKDDGFMDFKLPSGKILRTFRAYTPWPGIWTTYCGKRLKLLDIELNDEVLPPGVIKCKQGEILAGAGDGSLVLKELQLESKNIMHAKQFVIGCPDFCKASLPS